MLDPTPETGPIVEARQAPRFQPRTLSQVMRELAAREQGAVSVRCIRDALADRSFGTFLVLTSAINMLPFPPGSTLVLGIPIVLVALQMVAGRPTVWLPELFLRRSLSQKAFVSMTGRLIPMLERMEAWVRPRHWPFADRRRAERLIGLYAFVLGVAVILPVPFGNWLPAFACALCGLALSERDGLWLGLGVAIGLVSIAVIFGVVFVAGTLAMHWIAG
ncbi:MULTISPECIES: exopolysaccharide biosynthesis protein [unclassified Roseitalea]|uniref:exopolysaccharide biosynthesis protein n=1 Tax=unclassified Roseitalea TaxID=2639107 RepID=UPI00273E6C92|nr:MULTISPECIES: exopolysaccharide biosynthesis protein [unclassified Roseitalea]